MFFSRRLLPFFFFLFTTGLIFLYPKTAHALVCWPSVKVNQWACIPQGGCAPGKETYRCANDSSKDCDPYGSMCPAPYGGLCTVKICSDFGSSTTICDRTGGDIFVACNGLPLCCASVTTVTCYDKLDKSCGTNTTTTEYGCWGPGEDPTPTPGATSFCGDTNCDAGENCSNCSFDCGNCPPPITLPPSPPPTPTLPPVAGSIWARAVQVDPANTACGTPGSPEPGTIRAGGTGGIDGTTHQFSLSSASHPAPLTQSGSTYVVFNNMVAGDYGIVSSPPNGYVPARACWFNMTNGSSGETWDATLTSASLLTWDLGYTFGSAWVQAQGGDVYASGTLKSLVPVSPPLPAPRVFIKDGTTGGYPGVATYGGDCNFDSASAGCGGKTWVSSKNWLVNDPGSQYTSRVYREDLAAF